MNNTVKYHQLNLFNLYFLMCQVKVVVWLVLRNIIIIQIDDNSRNLLYGSFINVNLYFDAKYHVKDEPNPST